MMLFLDAVWETARALALPLMLGLFIAGLLHVFVRKESILRHLGRPGFVSSVKASIVGVPLPLCSCSVLPTAMGLGKDGASSGAVTSFLISTPQTGVDSIFVTWGILGWPIALAKVVTAFFAGVAGGTVADLIDNGGEGTGAGTTPCAEGEYGSLPARMWNYAVGTIFRDIYRWLTIGIVVSALIVTFLEPGQLADYPVLQGPLGLLAALLVGIPLYVCSTASVPIAAGLIYAGFPVGSALVFLMAGPATNAVTIGAVRKALGWRVFLVYIATVVVFSLAAGLLLNSLHVTASGGLHEHGGGLLQGIAGTAAAILMIFGILWYFVADLRAGYRAPLTQGASDRDLFLPVDGMSCGNCENRLRTALKELPGTGTVTVSASAGEALVSDDGSGRLRRADAEAVVAELGFRIDRSRERGAG